MKRLTRYSLAIASVALMTVFSSSCEDDIFPGFSEAESLFSDKYLATEAGLSSIYRIVDNAMRDSIFRATDSSLVEGALVTRMGSNVTIDFGGGVIGLDGRTRSGLITVLETGDYRTPGGQIQADLLNYVLDNFDVQGILDVENYGSDSLKLSVTALSVLDSLQMDGSKTIIWQQGFGTANPFDDQYTVIGSARGVMDVNSITTLITQPMVIDNSCLFRLTEGIIDLDFQMDTATVPTTGSFDFIQSDGCENLTRLKIKKGETEINLARQFFGF